VGGGEGRVGGCGFLSSPRCTFSLSIKDISAHHFVFAAFDEEEERLQLIHHFAPILYFIALFPS
jgi:hypothetical protein